MSGSSLLSNNSGHTSALQHNHQQHTHHQDFGFEINLGANTSIPSGGAAASMETTTTSSAGVGGTKRLLTRIQGVFAESFQSSMHVHSGGSSGGIASSHLTSRILIDRKIIEKVYKLIMKIVRYCQKPGVNLKNSPPYILDTLPDIYKYLKDIIQQYDETGLEALNEIDYFHIFMSTLVDKCKQTVKLFKEGRERMSDEDSSYRHKLTKYSLIFSHLLKDLQAMFPNHTYSQSSFKITKQDAARWWTANFDQRTIVPWRQFRKALFDSCTVPSGGDSERLADTSQISALQGTIDLTCNDHVSIFEFDVFVRLFQPWNNILETWKALAIVHPGYMAFMTYDEVKAVLNAYINEPGPGSYVFRLSCTKLGQWAIGYVTQDRQILQTIIQNKSLAQALLDGEREGFYRYPNGCQKEIPDLFSLVHNLPQVHIAVTQEQYQLYCEIGSTFEVCKICRENDKDIRVEPCGHLFCRSCLLSWQASGDAHSCPFCRREIKGTEEIVVDKFMASPSPPTAPLLAPPPRPPRLVGGGVSPAGSPSTHRRRLGLPPPPPPVLYTAPSFVPSVSCAVDLLSNAAPNHLNYATLEFTDSDTDLEDLPPAPPPPLPSAIELDVAETVGQSELDVLMAEGVSERVARRILSITHNNLPMARQVLLYFVPKPGQLL